MRRNLEATLSGGSLSSRAKWPRLLRVGGRDGLREPFRYFVLLHGDLHRNVDDFRLRVVGCAFEL